MKQLLDKDILQKVNYMVVLMRCDSPEYRIDEENPKDFEKYLKMNHYQHHLRKYCLDELASCSLLSVSTIVGTNMKIVEELLFGNEDLITKTNVNSVINESKVNDTANISLSSSMANVNDLSILCIPSGWDCIEYINILLPDDSNTDKTITAGSTLKAAATNTQNSSSSSNKNIVTNTTSLSPQHSMQSDQDFLKTLFDQQNKNAIHLGDSSAAYQSSADVNEISLSTENESMNNDVAVSDVDPSAFFLNLLQSKSM